MITQKTPDAKTECIAELLEGLKSWLLLAGVPEKQFVLPETAKFDRVNKAFNWLEEISKSPELAEVKRVRKLLPEEIWKRYELLEIEGLAEQNLLSTVLKDLLKKWRKDRPRLFGYVPKNKKS